jgi:hypothetical protein
MRNRASWLALDWQERRVGRTTIDAELDLEFLLLSPRGHVFCCDAAA